MMMMVMNIGLVAPKTFTLKLLSMLANSNADDNYYQLCQIFTVESSVMLLFLFCGEGEILDNI